MSALNYGLNHGYVEEMKVDGDAWKEFRINPRKILFQDMLQKIIIELSELGFEIIFDERSKVYYADNRRKMMNEQNEKATENLNNRDKVDKCCEECSPCYEDLKNNFIGACCAISDLTKVEPKEVAGILASKLYNEMKTFVDNGYDKKLSSLYEASNKLIEELDEFIRGEINE